MPQTRVSSDIDVKRPENHECLVSARFNFNFPQEWPIAITLVKTKMYTTWGKPLHLPSTAYAMMQFAEESDCSFDVALSRKNTLSNGCILKYSSKR